MDSATGDFVAPGSPSRPAQCKNKRIRIDDQKLPPKGIEFDVQEFSSDGMVYQAGDVKVTAFEVDHGPLIKPAYGYRVDYRGRSVVISGDTRFNENLIKYSMNTDLLIHEVAAAPDSLRDMPVVKRILDHHTSAEEYGDVFTKTKPRLAVYTHLVLLSSPKTPPLTLPELEAQTRRTYSGPLVIAEDLIRFVVGQDIQVKTFDALNQRYN